MSEHPEWWKEPIHPNGTVIGCLNCGDTPHLLPMDTRLYNGFGGWTVFRDGKVFFSDEARDKEWDEWKRLSEIEESAKADPNHDWIAEVFLPLRGASYQRHGENEWVLVETNIGFA